MSFKKWFSENVVELPSKDENVQNEQGKNFPNQVTTPVYQNPIVTPMAPVIPTVQGSDQELMVKFLEHFQKVFNDANLPGPDYFEFSTMKNTPAMSVIPEPARFAACFSALSVQGLTKQKLIETAQQYVQVLDADSTDFGSQLETKYKETVGKMTEEAAHLDDLIQTSTKQIEELNKTIADASARKQQLSVEIAQQDQSLKTKKSYYDFALGQMKQTISDDVNKVNQYIQ